MILFRARLRRDAQFAALAPLLLPSDPGMRAGADHRLVWSLFADNPDHPRDFLWRRDGERQFLVLAARDPHDPHDLFEIDAPKAWTPVLAPGDRLGFLLRANPTVQPSAPRGAARPPRSDVVLHALRGLKDGARAEARPELVREAGADWLARQGEAKGFAVETDRLSVDGYETWRIPRGSGKEMRFSTLDFSGVLRVRDPAAFVAAVAQGFGRARAFGCGLMLLRRAAG